MRFKTSMNTLVKRFFKTDTQSWVLLIARISLGVVILPHGAQKALGLFDGHGLAATIGHFQSMGMPLLLAVLVISAEFIGSLGMILGLGTRFMAFSIFVTFFGAMFLGGHADHGFFMNWMGNQAGEGIEYFIMLLGLAIIGMIGGGGKCSVDGLIDKKIDTYK
jgi:putative oxidoreductase